MSKPRTILYTLIAEGFTEYKFISVYLFRLADSMGLRVKRSSVDLLKSQPSKSRVLTGVYRLGITALQEENHNLFVVGVDLDQPDHTPEQRHHAAQLDELSAALKSLRKAYSDRIVLYVPVRAIESWLAYQAYKTNGSACPSAHSMESKQQNELKAMLYGNKNAKILKMESVAKAIAEKADFDELARQSRSFKHFHDQVIDFLKTAAA
jgi:hypothetical protein